MIFIMWSLIHNLSIFFLKKLKRINRLICLLRSSLKTGREVFGKEYYKLGFGQPLGISAEHKLGFGELYEKIAPEIEEYEKNFGDVAFTQEENDDEESLLQIAIVGRPNAGKSTFLNKILGQDRLIVGPEAGITRDAIAIDHEFQGRRVRFIDTAGIRKKASITQKLEKLSALDSFRAIRFAQVVILLIDANSPLDHQDKALAGEILREGRGLIFGINKIDSIKGDKEHFLRELRKDILAALPGIDGAPIVGLSSKTGYNVEKTLEYALKTYGQWQAYIQTNKLHDWLKMAEAKHSPKLYKGKPIKLKYATQIKKRPPTFAVFTNHIKPLMGSYQQYLINSLRETFDLTLTPIRLVLKKSENPFADVKKKVFSKETHKPKNKKTS